MAMYTPIDGNEQAYFDFLWTKAHEFTTAPDVLSGSEAVAFFSKSMIKTGILPIV
jgi:hypothetical protein